MRELRRCVAVTTLVAGGVLFVAARADAAPVTFTVPTSPIRPGQSVTFSSLVACGAPVVCAWTTSTGASLTDATELTASFPSLGPHTVTLTVDPNPLVAGDETSEQATVTVAANRVPAGTITVRPGLAVVGQRVDVAATATDPDGDVVGYEWDVNEDGIVDSTTPTASFSPAFAGLRTVRLTVADPFGGVQTVSLVVPVNAFPFPAFSVTPATPQTGQTVTLRSTSQDPDGVLSEDDLAWDLDADGQYTDAVGSVATRVFPRPGVFPVSLRVRDRDGTVSLAFHDLIVSAPAALAAAVARGSGELAPEAAKLRPFPTLRIAGRFSRRGALLSRVVADAPPLATVNVTCQGRGCTFSRRTFAPGRVRPLERVLLPPGTRVVIAVNTPTTIGKYTSITIRRSRPPLRVDRCVRPGSLKASACPL